MSCRTQYMSCTTYAMHNICHAAHSALHICHWEHVSVSLPCKYHCVSAWHIYKVYHIPCDTKTIEHMSCGTQYMSCSTYVMQRICHAAHSALHICHWEHVSVSRPCKYHCVYAWHIYKVYHIPCDWTYVMRDSGYVMQHICHAEYMSCRTRVCTGPT